MFRRVSSQAQADRCEAAATARYGAASPLRAYRACRTLVEEACKSAEAHARLEIALNQRRSN